MTTMTTNTTTAKITSGTKIKTTKITAKKRTNKNTKHAKQNVTDPTTTDLRAASHFHYLACQMHACDGQETASDTTHCFAQVPSDSSTTCSEELLDIETVPPLLDEPIAPIFEEEDDLEGQETDEEEDDDDDNGELEEEEDEEDVDVEDGAEIVLDVEKDDFEFCASSRKSTHSVKSSSSRYDKLLSLATPKLVLPTSQSFNDNSRKQISLHGKSKTRTNGQQSTSKNDKSRTGGGSQKNIVKRALMSLSTTGSSSGSTSNNNARPKSTSSLRFGHNKLHFLTGSTKYKQKQIKTNMEQEEQATTSSSMAASNTPTAATTTNTTTTTTTTTNTTTTKTNLSNIITSLLRTTTL